MTGGHLTDGWEPDLPVADTLARQYVFNLAAFNELPAVAAGARVVRTDEFAAADLGRPAAIHNAATLVRPLPYDRPEATLDAVECQPTFGVSSDRVVALIAGGASALTRSVEGAEDDRSAAVKDLEDLSLDPGDIVVGLAASGRTPYVVAAVRHASELGCATVGISNNPGSELGAAAHVCIELITGAEVLTGSTRLKAGTSEKLVLNMLSTAAFARLNKVYENFMVDLQAGNEKLKGRSLRIVREAAGVTEDEGGELLRAADGSVKVAVVMGKARVPADAARELLAAAGGNVRRALDAGTPTVRGDRER